MNSKKQGNVKITYSRPPYRDKSLNIIHDINKAWQSIDVLKEKLRNADYKLNSDSKESKSPVKSSVSSNLQQNLKRKRKVLRFDKVECNNEPKETLYEPKSRSGTKNLETVSEIPFSKRPSKGLRTTDDEKDHFDLTLARFLMAEVPVVNDRLQTSKSKFPSYFDRYDDDDDGLFSPKLTYVDVEMVRAPPTQRKRPPSPPQPQRIVHWPVSNGRPETKPRDRVQPATVKMAWEPVVQIDQKKKDQRRQHIDNDVAFVGGKTLPSASEDVRRNEEDSTNNQSKVSWTQLPKTSDPPLDVGSAASTVKSTEPPQETRRPPPPPNRKVTIIKPEKLERGVINPFSWRKGKELILKELGPFKPVRTVEKKTNDSEDEVTEEPTSQKDLVTSASKKISSSQKTKSVTIIDEVKDKEDNLEEPKSNEESVAPKEAPEKRVKKPMRRRAVANLAPIDKTSNDSQRQSTPKLRHYDQASVRRYIREQREERRKKAESEKGVLQTMKATRQQKLKDLQEKQKELAKSRLTTSPNSKRTKEEAEAGRSLARPRIPDTLTWIDLVTPKPNQPSDDDDFAYKRLMQTGATMKVSAWTKNGLQKRSKYEESSSEEERVTSSDGSTTNQSSVVERTDEGLEPTVKDLQLGASSKEANERLKLLSEAGRQTVEVLMTKMMRSGTDRGGRAAKLELLKQQAFGIQNGIDEEMKRLKHRLRSKDVPIVTSSPLSQTIEAELPGVAKVDSKAMSTKKPSNVIMDEADGKSKESWELSLSEGPLSSEDDYERNDRENVRRSPPRTDEILQLVLASTIFANSNSKQEPPKKIEKDVVVAKNEITNVATDDRGHDDQILTSVVTSAVDAKSDALQSKASSHQDVDVTSEQGDFSSVPDVQYSRHTPSHSSASSSISLTMNDNGRSSVKDGYDGGGLSLGRLTSPSKDTDREQTQSASSIEEELSEGSIESISNFERGNGSHLSRNESLVGVGEDTVDEPRKSIQSDDNKVSSDDDSSKPNGSLDEETTDISIQSNVSDTSGRKRKDVVPSFSQDENSVVATKMSPNALCMRMRAELTYLDTVHESLDQLNNVERMRAVSMAQQEAVALAQVIQTRNVEGGLKVAETFASPLANLQVLQSQAEAAKMATETAKTLAEANNSLVAVCNNNLSLIRATSTQDTVAAAAAAAVTATLSQLQLNLRRHRDRADSFLSSLSSVAVSQRSSKRGSSGSQSSSSIDSEGSQTGARRKRKSSTESGEKGDRFESAHTSPILEDILSEGPISPAPSSDIREQFSRNGDISEGAADDSFTEEEEKSFRIVLPSESHLRSSRRNEQLRRMGSGSRRTAKSPSSDDQQSKRSSSSVSSDIPLTEGGDDDDDASNGSLASASHLLENVPLFSGEDSFQQFTLTMVKQYMEEEEMRNQHQRAILKLREQALVEKTKAELAWIELQKKQFRIKGQDEKMPPLYKKERGLLLRLKQETADLQRLQEAQSIASKERQEIMKKQQEQMIQLTLSARPHELDENSGNLDNMEGNIQGAAKTEERLDVHSEITAQVLQGLKKLQASKRYLTRREQKLLLRRKHVEHLLNWQKQLDDEEARVQEMEQMALGVLAGSSGQNARDGSKKPSGEQQITDKITVSVSEEIVEEPTEQSSVSERIQVNRSVSTDDSYEEDIGITSATTDDNVSETKNESEITKDVVTSKVSSTSSQVSPRTSSVILRSPLTPRRLRSRIRKESSGSEDSCTVSHSETTSELSDVEGRVHALKEDLRRRKIEAEKLRREHKRKNKDRLKAQEASLLKQIEAYDKFIAQTRLDLQKELEEGQSKVLVRPVIKQPKVAESKRLQKQQGSAEGPPRSPESGGIGQQSAASSLSVTEISEQLRDSEDVESKLESTNVATVSPDTSLEESVEEFSQRRSSDQTPKLAENGDSEANNLEISQRRSSDPTVKLTERQDLVLAEDVSDRIPKDNEEKLQDTEKKDEDKNTEEVINKLELHVSEHDGTLSFKSEITEDVLSFGEDVQESTESDRRLKQSEDHNRELLRAPVSESGDLKTAVSEHKTETLPKSLDLVERNRAQMMVDIADTVLEGLLAEELRSRSRTGQAKDTNTCDKITDSVLRSIITESVDVCVNIYDSKYEKVELGNEDVSLKNDSQQSPVSSVSERVSLIMAEVNERRCSTSDSGCSSARRTRTQDLLILSFPDVISPPADDIILSPTGSPVRGSREVSLVRRPSSPVLGEPSEANNENSIHHQTFEGLDVGGGGGDDDWFDEVYGLGTSLSDESANKKQMSDDQKEAMMQHYQIYPYQGGGYYIREIPNKPPPPYTPPGQATSSTQATAAAVTATPPFSGTSILNADLKRLTTDFYEAVNYDRDEISILLAKAVQFVNVKRPNERIEDFFTTEDYEEDIANRSRRVYKHFLLDLVEETVDTIQEEERRHPRHPWLRPEWPTRPASTSVCNTVENLSAEVRRRVLPLLFENGGNGVGNSGVPTYGCKRKDFVDEILLQELRREEKEWVTYDEDEATVKMQLADSIFEDLIAETVGWMQKLSKHSVTH